MPRKEYYHKNKDRLREYQRNYDMASAMCGKLKVDAHHEDYAKPLVVKWLCRSCHVSLHKATEIVKQT